MKFPKKTITSVPLENQTVLVRVDYNVPLEEDGSIADDFRIRSSLPTIQYLLKHGCKVVLIAHLGRPEGPDLKFSLEPTALRLSELLGEPVRFVDKTVGEKVRMAIKRAPKRSVIVLENTRFNPGEKDNDESFARQLAQDTGARYFVQDAFGNVHRGDASMAAITSFLPSVAGLLVEKEYTQIVSAMKHPKRPLVAILGGAKVSDKIQVIREFVDKADTILIGGAMANTFLAYNGVNVGASKREDDQSDIIREIYEAAVEKVGSDSVQKFIVLPSDVVVAKSPDATELRKVPLSDINDDDMCLDIGPSTAIEFVSVIDAAGTVVWNGTLGYAERPEFAAGSERIAEEIASRTHITSIIGGGDTADFVLHWDEKKGESFSHVSTGGGASLELMAGEKLPGVEHLLDA
ncbi:MAG TPA: phosphoglycerate kinase [Candidatus Saccharibacteria bacterium]|nr:phosphoglycerate kinase [Candidatus Saccharibacteria bacterium]